MLSRSTLYSLYNFWKDQIGHHFQNSSIIVCLFVAVETWLATRYPATDVLLLLRTYLRKFNLPLPSNGHMRHNIICRVSLEGATSCRARRLLVWHVRHFSINATPDCSKQLKQKAGQVTTLSNHPPSQLQKTTDTYVRQHIQLI
jgi:hypothetical protein